MHVLGTFRNLHSGCLKGYIFLCSTNNLVMVAFTCIIDATFVAELCLMIVIRNKS